MFFYSIVPYTDLGSRGFFGIYRRSCFTMLTKFDTLVTPKVVKMAKFVVASDQSFFKSTTPCSVCKEHSGYFDGRLWYNNGYFVWTDLCGQLYAKTNDSHMRPLAVVGVVKESTSGAASQRDYISVSAYNCTSFGCSRSKIQNSNKKPLSETMYIKMPYGFARDRSI